MIKQATPDTIKDAAELLHQGELIAFPTETVFGLAADATNDAAIIKLYDVKNRPRDKAFSIMIADLDQAKKLAVFDNRALTLAQVFWPGPLSMILPVQENSGLSDTALLGNKTISLRMPKHPVPLNLLRACNKPLAVPSANSSGRLSTTNALDVSRDLGNKVAIILADATPIIGIESTIIDLTKTPAVIIRSGAVSVQEIAELIGDVVVNEAVETSTLNLKSKLRLNAVDVKPGEAFLGFGNLNYIGVQDIGFVKNMQEHLWRNLSAQGDLHEAASNLYAMLQQLDQTDCETIAVMKLPEDGLGIVLNDRLKRMTGR